MNRKTRILGMCAVLLFLAACSAKPADAGPPEINAGENLTISLSEISSTALFYPVKVDGTRMEVFAVRAPDGSVRTAFNTCQVCNGSPRAYFVQTGGAMECQNCGNRFPMERIGGEAGGCNPVPVPESGKTVTDGALAISYDALQANARRFPSNWKQP